MLCCLFFPVGFVGYLPSDKSIYVVFRGSSSIRNWITNLDAYKTSYTSYPACKCEVHKGFYGAEQIVIGGIISEVKRLKSISSLSTYSVKTTGHSLGAALAQLTAMGKYPFPVFRKYKLDNVECIFSTRPTESWLFREHVQLRSTKSGRSSLCHVLHIYLELLSRDPRQGHRPAYPPLHRDGLLPRLLRGIRRCMTGSSVY